MPAALSPKSPEDVYIESIKGLLHEQIKINEEEKRIRENKHMTFVDKCDAVKSVRSVSRTIEGLIDKEKERLTEYCKESQYTRNP